MKSQAGREEALQFCLMTKYLFPPFCSSEVSSTVLTTYENCDIMKQSSAVLEMAFEKPFL